MAEQKRGESRSTDPTPITRKQREQAPDPDGWEADLLIRGKRVAACIPNVVHILTHDPHWRALIAYDAFRGEEMMTRKPPWGDTYRPSRVGDQSCELKNADDARIATWLGQRYGMIVQPRVVKDAVQVVARAHEFHPVRDYLQGLGWDGERRLSTWVSRYLGAKQTDITNKVGVWWMRGAVARIMRPGVQMDTMLILEGPQGIRKSTAVKTLASPSYFSDELKDFGEAGALQLRGRWIIEVGELGTLRASEVDVAKAFLSRTADKFRVPYGSRVEEFPRQCVFAGTTNRGSYLKDPTGNRRFWPLTCGILGPIQIELLERDRDQLWAEALVDFRANKPWWTEDKDELAALEAMADLRTTPDAWAIEVLKWAEQQKMPFDMADVFNYALEIPKVQWTRSNTARISNILRGGGYESKSTSQKGIKGHYWTKAAPVVHWEAAPEPEQDPPGETLQEPAAAEQQDLPLLPGEPDQQPDLGASRPHDVAPPGEDIIPTQVKTEPGDEGPAW